MQFHVISYAEIAVVGSIALWFEKLENCFKLIRNLWLWKLRHFPIAQPINLSFSLVWRKLNSNKVVVELERTFLEGAKLLMKNGLKKSFLHNPFHVNPTWNEANWSYWFLSYRDRTDAHSVSRQFELFINLRRESRKSLRRVKSTWWLNLPRSFVYLNHVSKPLKSSRNLNRNET